MHNYIIMRNIIYNSNMNLIYSIMGYFKDNKFLLLTKPL